MLEVGLPGARPTQFNCSIQIIPIKINNNCETGTRTAPNLAEGTSEIIGCKLYCKEILL